MTDFQRKVKNCFGIVLPIISTDRHQRTPCQPRAARKIVRHSLDIANSSKEGPSRGHTRLTTAQTLWLHGHAFAINSPIHNMLSSIFNDIMESSILVGASKFMHRGVRIIIGKPRQGYSPKVEFFAYSSPSTGYKFPKERSWKPFTSSTDLAPRFTVSDSKLTYHVLLKCRAHAICL